MAWWNGDPGSKEENEYADRRVQEQKDMDARRTQIYEQRHPGKTRKRRWDLDAFYVHSPGTQHLNEFEDHMEDEFWDLREYLRENMATKNNLLTVIEAVVKRIGEGQQQQRIDELKKEVEYWKSMALGLQTSHGKNNSDRGNLHVVSR